MFNIIIKFGTYEATCFLKIVEKKYPLFLADESPRFRGDKSINSFRVLLPQTFDYEAVVGVLYFVSAPVTSWQETIGAK